jgi:hypothetical protein
MSTIKLSSFLRLKEYQITPPILIVLPREGYSENNTLYLSRNPRDPRNPINLLEVSRWYGKNEAPWYKKIFDVHVIYVHTLRVIYKPISANTSRPELA